MFDAHKYWLCDVCVCVCLNEWVTSTQERNSLFLISKYQCLGCQGYQIQERDGIYVHCVDFKYRVSGTKKKTVEMSDRLQCVMIRQIMVCKDVSRSCIFWTDLMKFTNLLGHSPALMWKGDEEETRHYRGKRKSEMMLNTPVGYSLDLYSNTIQP